jgi:hypothetical protein
VQVIVLQVGWQEWLIRDVKLPLLAAWLCNHTHTLGRIHKVGGSGGSSCSAFDISLRTHADRDADKADYMHTQHTRAHARTSTKKAS